MNADALLRLAERAGGAPNRRAVPCDLQTAFQGLRVPQGQSAHVGGTKGTYSLTSIGHYRPRPHFTPLLNEETIDASSPSTRGAKGVLEASKWPKKRPNCCEIAHFELRRGRLLALLRGRPASARPRLAPRGPKDLRPRGVPGAASRGAQGLGGEPIGTSTVQPGLPA